MAESRHSRRRWCGKLFFGVAVGVGAGGAALGAEPTVPPPSGPQAVSASLLPAEGPPRDGDRPGVIPALTAAPPAGASACAPDWCDPVSRVPDFFGDFFARGSSASRTQFLTHTRTVTNTQTLTFTGGGEGFINDFVGRPVVVGPSLINPTPLTVQGPGGPYTLPIQGDPRAVSSTINGTGSAPTFAAIENTQLTGLVRANFPGATFQDGTITTTGELNAATFVLDYLFRTTQTITFTTAQTLVVNLPNPAGGGLAGRNVYFDDGSPLPRDRAYFFYNSVGSYQGLGQRFDVNRYVVGGEKAFLDGRASVEVRVPFAGTADSDQTAGQGLAVDHAEFGNVGLVAKGLIYRTPNLAVSVGVGVSLPTADDSRMLVDGQTVIQVRNDTCLVQPLLGVAWAPDDRFYAQAGVQFDLDPTGNAVWVLNPQGGLTRAGVLNDQGYAYLGGAAGYWLYQGAGTLTGVALQGELHYNRSFGPRDSVQQGGVVVTDLGSHVDLLDATVGTVVRFGERADLGVAVAFPVAGSRLYDWNLMAQFTYAFGPRSR